MNKDLSNKFARLIENNILLESNLETTSLYEKNIKELFNNIKVILK